MLVLVNQVRFSCSVESDATVGQEQSVSSKEFVRRTMAPKIFITGITGYIAGDAFYAIHKAHPDYEYSALIRTEEKAGKVRASYPDVRVVIGGLDDSSIIEEESAKADIVLHAADASDHEGAAKAIEAGILKGHSAERPGFWLHTGGTGILTYFDSSKERFGEEPDREFNDWSGVKELTTLPDDAFHRNVDKIVLEAGTKHADVIKTALVVVMQQRPMVGFSASSSRLRCK
ncbi:unnamed protein product [Cercospora beticola]|nr:unnamed protein product [Cercospora beticola]